MTVRYVWTVNPLNFLNSVNTSVASKTREVSEAIFDGVVERSPVDTGSFRASWNVSVNEENLNRVEGGSSSSPLSPPRFPNINVNNFSKVFITNATPYGPQLENGYSGQAPQGIVAATLASLNR